MKLIASILAFCISSQLNAQQFANGDFKKWDKATNCPMSWNCNNDADCKGKVTPADKISGGAKLTVIHCWDPKKDDRSNNVNVSYDDLQAKIPQGKKVKISFDYTYTPVGNDAAYVKIDADFDEEVNDGFPVFLYNDSDKGILKPGANIHFVCYLNFDPAHGKNYVAPQNCTANSIRTAFGIMPAEGGTDVHKGTTLIINHVKLNLNNEKEFLQHTRLAVYIFCTKAQDNNHGINGFNPQTFNVSDSLPVTLNGLKAGYTIESESEKSVGKKGDFSRFKIKFWLTNTTTEAKIMYRNMSFGGHFGPITNNIALFKCLNATGARFTNKMATMELQPCKIQATVEDKECGTEKIVQNTRVVDIGYWIRPGETVSKTYPMIVPLNEKPKVTVTFYAEPGNQSGTFMGVANQQPNSNENFARIKNFATNTYLNNQSGTLQCTTIENGWWSADWEIIPVAGSNNFQIRNRWKNNFLSSDNGMLTDNANSLSAMWMIQETSTLNLFYIKNVNDNSRLYVENGQLKISNSFISNDNASKWIIEK